MLIDLFSQPTAPCNSVLPTGSAATLAPLWAADALHRANNLAQMASALELTSGRNALGGSIKEVGVTARALARAYAELGARELTGIVVPCRPLLEAIVTRLVELFRGDRTIDLTLSLADLGLPADRRRALTLIASELVINAPKYAFPENHAGHLTVSLTRTADVVELIVA
ncbi:sensor histidine kinase, partial [Sphingomonas sp. BT553]|nr:sensor histidine kinase [Sphingomonas sp. BT553]